MKINKVFCLFEQSGTFKNEFKRLWRCSMKMTNDQIIRELDAFRDYFIEERGAEPVCFGEAIRVIREEVRPHGKWEIDTDNIPICTECGEVALQRVFVKMPHLLQEVRMVQSNYCPNCGAKMDKKEADND